MSTINEITREEVDMAILQAVQSGVRVFAHITEVVNERLKLPNQLLAAGVERCIPWRVVDRRLQALRKAGKLAYQARTGWSIVGQPIG